MKLQKVHEAKVFDRSPNAPGFGRPIYVFVIHFSELALTLMSGKRKTADSEASGIVKNLTRGEIANFANRPGSWVQINHPVIDLDALGESGIHPDGAGTRVWVTVAPQGSMLQPVVRAQ